MAGSGGSWRRLIRLQLMASAIALVVANADEKHGFCYKGITGPEFWGDMEPKCGGHNQSPINLDACLSADDVKLPPIRFSRGYSELVAGRLENNGHTVQFVPTDEWRRKLVVSGGPLGDDHFCMENFHFHWGSMDAQGSEHTVNRRRFPMEMHLVHRNMRYASLSEALDKSDGLMVLAVLFEKDPYDGHGQWMEGIRPYKKLCNDFLGSVGKVCHPGKSVHVPAMNISTHFHLDFHKYFLYSGSLTTPTCNEGVKWIVPTCFSYVTCQQLEIFRQVFAAGSDDHQKKFMSDNFRPTQPLNRRRVYLVCNEKDKLAMAANPVSAVVPPQQQQQLQQQQQHYYPQPHHQQHPPPPPPVPAHQLSELNEDMQHYSEAIKKKILSAYESGSSLQEIKKSLGLLP